VIVLEVVNAIVNVWKPSQPWHAHPDALAVTL
jgi:hypothetical protein